MAEEKEPDKFVEIDGDKYQEDPDKPGEALKDDKDELVPFEETSSEETPSEEEEKEEKKEKKEEKKEEEKEPETRFPKEPEEKPEQSKDKKREGFKYRKAKKILKREGLLDELEEETEEEEEESEEPEGEKTDVKELTGKVDKLEKTQASSELLKQFLDENPAYKKYEARIRKHMDHKAYQQVPIGFIAQGIAGPEFAARAAEEKKKADEEAEETESGGSEVKKSPTGKMPKIWDMSKKDFAKYQEGIKQKGRE